MSFIKILLLTITGVFLLALASCNSSIEAGETPDGWSNSQKEVFANAKAEDKYIFLFAGRSTCPNCQKTLININDTEIQSIIDDSYILWHIDWDSVKQSEDKETEGKFYVEEARTIGFKVLPAIFVIDPHNPEAILKFESGLHSVDELKTFLNIEDLIPQ